MSVADLASRVRRLSVRPPMASESRMMIGVHPEEGGVTGASRAGRYSRPVALDACWDRELARVVANPDAVRVEHHWVLALPDGRHAGIWRHRVVRAGPVTLSPFFRLCDLAIPAMEAGRGLSHFCSGVAACNPAVGFGQPVPGTNRYPGLYLFLESPPYLFLTGPFPPLTGLKSAASWRLNHGVFGVPFRVDIRSAL